MAYGEKRGKFWRVKYMKPNGREGSASKDDYGNRFRTEKAAEAYGNALETDSRRGTFIDPRAGEITVREWAAKWLQSIDVGPTSLRDYKSRLNHTILPHWGDVAVRDVLAIDVAIWEKGLRAELAKNTVDGIISVFRTMFADAIVSKLRSDNPVTPKSAGRRGRHVPKPKEKKVIGTPRQILLIAQNGLLMRSFNEYALVLTSAYTGLRIGEAAGLHRDQLVLRDTGIGYRLLIASQSQYVDGQFTEIGPKYDSGRGLIIPKSLAMLLRELVVLHSSSEWVFTAPKGGRLLRGGDWYTDTWHPMVDGRPARPVVRGAKARVGVAPVLGVAGMVPHGLRHSHKSWLDEDGHSRVAVEERMGHVLPGVEGTYSQVTLPMELAIAESLERRWQDALRHVAERPEHGAIPPWEPPQS